MQNLNELHERNSSFSKETPGFQIAWDSTSLGLFKACPKKYFYTMIEGWHPRGQALPLIFGIHYHKALETYDLARANGYSHEGATNEAVRLALQIQDGKEEDDPRFMPRKTDCTYRNRENLVRAIVWYLDHFKEDKAETVILKNGKPAVELTFKMEIPFPYHQSKEQLLLCGHMDRIVQFGSEIYVMDHKTTKLQPNDYYFSQFSPDNQVSLYTLAAKVVLGETAKGVIINACQLGVNFCRFLRRPVSRTPDQTKEWLEETKTWINLAMQYAIEGHWPMNDTACDKYGGCQFKEVCSTDPAVRPYLLKSNFYKRTWDPMKAR